MPMVIIETKFKMPIFLGAEHESYKINIENLARIKDSKIFNNSDPAHAAIVLGNIMNTANFDLKIFAGNFNGAVSDHDYYLTALDGYLKRKLPLTIIFEKDPNPKSLALALLDRYSDNNSNLSVRKIKADINVSNNLHFTIADSRMFRLERSSENYQARCSFNNRTVAGLLESEFSALHYASESIDYKELIKAN